MGLSHLSTHELAAWVAASCAAQGVPVKITDPTVIRRVGALLGEPGAGMPGGVGGGSRAHPRSGSTRPATARPADLSRGRSVPPHDGRPGGVEFLGTGGAGADHHVVDQGVDDGVLPVEVEGSPGAA